MESDEWEKCRSSADLPGDRRWKSWTSARQSTGIINGDGISMKNRRRRPVFVKSVFWSRTFYRSYLGKLTSFRQRKRILRVLPGLVPVFTSEDIPLIAHDDVNNNMKFCGLTAKKQRQTFVWIMKTWVSGLWKKLHLLQIHCGISVMSITLSSRDQYRLFNCLYHVCLIMDLHH